MLFVAGGAPLAVKRSTKVRTSLHIPKLEATFSSEMLISTYKVTSQKT
jgi:hypothetical protein